MIVFLIGHYALKHRIEKYFLVLQVRANLCFVGMYCFFFYAITERNQLISLKDIKYFIFICIVKKNETMFAQEYIIIVLIPLLFILTTNVISGF